MTDPIPFRRPINWANLRADEAERLIHERAQDSAKVGVIGHPEEREEARGILRTDLFHILRTGTVTDPPQLNGHGDWEAVIRRRMRGGRDAAAATIVLREDRIIVKTVMWVDPR